MPAARTALLVACLTLSGAAGLVYQTAWIRELAVVYGNTVYASGALLAAFMGGLAAGGALGSRWLRAHPEVGFRAYAALELAIAVTGVLSQWLLPINEWLMVEVIGFRPMGYGALAAKALAALPFILPPTVAMGATLPIFVRAWVVSMHHAGARLALAYSLNTLGAVAGTLAAAFLLIPGLGVRGTIWTAASVNLGVGLLALAIGGRRRAPAPTPAASPDADAAAPAEARTWPAVVYGATGFAAIAAEVMWTRVLVLHVGNTVHAFAVMLAVVLIGIGLGSLLVARWADRLGVRAWLLCLAALGASLVLHLYPVRRLSDLFFAFAPLLRAGDFANVLAISAVTGMLPLLVPTLLMGVAFPLGIRVLSATPGGLAQRTGRLYAANSVGAIFGAIFTSTALLGWLGVNGTAFVIACVYCGTAALAAARLLSWRPALLAGVALPLFLLALLPAEPVLLRLGQHRTGPASEIVAFEEGVTNTVTVRRSGGTVVIEVDLTNVAGTTPQLVTTQKLQAHLPLLIHPDPRSVLHIGFGSGGTTWAVTRHPVERIDVVEISPDVVRMSNRFFPKVNRGAAGDPRVRFHWGDGRNYLLASERIYDVILSDSIHPSTAGNGSLYTVEYFRHAARRLAPGGIFSTWLPMYGLTPDNFRQILKALAEAFPHVTVWYAHNTVNRWVIATGSNDPDFALPSAGAAARFARPEVRADLAELDYEHPLDLYDNLLVGDAALRPLLADVEPHHDDRPRAEFESGFDSQIELNWRHNLAWLVRHRDGFRRYLAEPGAWPEERVDRYAEASDLVVQGHLAHLSCRPRLALLSFQRALALLPHHREPWHFERVVERERPPWCAERPARGS